jgi:hypothetical protein
MVAAIPAKIGAALPVHMIKLTETDETAPYKWVHPDEEHRARRFTEARFEYRRPLTPGCRLDLRRS